MPNFPLLPKVLYFSLKSTEILYFSKIKLSASNYSIFDVIYLPPLNSAHFYLRNWKCNGKQMLIVGQMLFQRKDLYSQCKVHIIRISVLYSVNIIVLESVSYSHSQDRSQQHVDSSCSFCIIKSIGFLRYYQYKTMSNEEVLDFFMYLAL